MKKLLLMICIALFICETEAQTSTFKTGVNDQRNTTIFFTEAPLEDILGTTRKMESEVMINVKNVSLNPKGTVKVDLSSLTTGIDLRDKDMKSADYLNTAKYPYAIFSLTGISEAVELKDAKKTNVMLSGNLTIRGVTKNISVPVELTYFKQGQNTQSKLKGNLLKVSSTFNIKMSDFGIEVPSLLLMKVSNDVKITVNFVATDADSKSAVSQCNPCNPCSPKKGTCSKSQSNL